LNQVFDILIKTRESKGWNKSQMARELGVSSQLYGQYETGAKKPGADFFIRWKDKFGVDLLETKVSHETKRESFESSLDKLADRALMDGRTIDRLISLLELKLKDLPPAPTENLREKANSKR
jgi:transcriptional regulator with XRE-family HTH domain